MNTPPLGPSRPPAPAAFSIAGVVATNDSATETKVRAVQLGYYSDPYAARVSRTTPPSSGGSPLMHRGYFARVRFVAHAFTEFLQATSTAATASSDPAPIQVVSLGCGSDSAYFRLTSDPSVARRVRRWVDVDFPEVIDRKKRAIEADSELKALATDSDRYRLVAADLRDCAGFMRMLEEEGLAARDVPTLVVSECVLVYLPKEDGDAVISALASYFATAAFVTYEQIRPETLFGVKMVENLKARNCALLSVHAYPSLESQDARYKACGFGEAVARDMNAVWNALPQAEKARVNRIEMMDELEEWHLIHSHYCFACAAKGLPAGWCESLFST